MPAQREGVILVERLGQHWMVVCSSARSEGLGWFWAVWLPTPPGAPHDPGASGWAVGSRDQARTRAYEEILAIEAAVAARKPATSAAAGGDHGQGVPVERFPSPDIHATAPTTPIRRRLHFGPGRPQEA